MGTLPLLPGEHEELRLRPSPTGFLAAYGLSLVPATAGAVLFGLSRVSGWQNPKVGSEDWQFWNHLWGDDQALGFYVVAGVVVAALLDYAVRRRARSFVLATVALVLMMLGATVLRGTATRTALPMVLASLSAPALIWVEWRRRSTRYIFTNLRLIIRTSMPRLRQRAVRHQDLVDLRARPAWRDAGTLVPVLGKEAQAAAGNTPPLRFAGIRPFARVRAFVELLIQRATAGDYLRAEERLDQRIAEARSALQRQA